jgi:peptide/nickel transport system permease protein
MHPHTDIHAHVRSGVTHKTHGPSFLARLARDRVALVSLGFVGAVAILALIGPPIWTALAPAGNPALHSYDIGDFNAIRAWPSAVHPLGTDEQGRDTLARLLMGLRVSLLVAAFVETINIVLGATLGLMAGTYGGPLDFVVSRLADMLFAFPGLLLAILVSAVFGQWAQDVAGDMGRLLLVSGALALVSWPLMARYVRGQALAIKGREFVAAARSIGATEHDIMVRHILPNVTGLIVTAATLDVPGVILSEAVLSLLGLGIQVPGSSLGLMIVRAIPYLENNWFQVLVPSITLTLLVLAFSFLGDGIRDALDPQTS